MRVLFSRKPRMQGTKRIRIRNLKAVSAIGESNLAREIAVRNLWGMSCRFLLSVFTLVA